MKEALTKRRLSTLSRIPLPASCLASKFIKSVEAVVFVLPPLDHCHCLLPAAEDDDEDEDDDLALYRHIYDSI